MYSLCLIELEFHGECLRTLLEVLQDVTDFEVHCAIHQEHEALVNNYVPHDRVEVYDPRSDKEQFLRGIRHRFDKMDGLIILTLEQHWKAYLNICKRYPVLLRVHGLNYVKNQRPDYIRIYQTLGFKGLLGELKWKNYYFKEQVLKVVKSITPTLSIEEDLRPNLPVEYKWIDPLPMSYNRYRTVCESNTSFKVVVPGAVSMGKRNYAHVFNAIKALSKSEFEWAFLGKVIEPTLQKELTSLKNDGYRLRFFENEVGWDVFDSELKAAHLIWAPVNEMHPFKDVLEYPGKTKITGSVSDALYFGKPILIPAFYPKPHYLNTGFTTYSNEKEIVGIIKEIRQKYVSLKPVSKGYDLKDTSAQTVNLLMQWLDSLKRS